MRLKAVLKQLFIVSAALLTLQSAAVADDTNWFSKQTKWHGHAQYHFQIADRAAYLVVPDEPLEGNPWIWRARFPGYHAEMDVDLVSRGFHVGYVDVAGLFGAPQAMEIGDRFYDFMTQDRGLAKRPVLEGVSRGGLFVYNWAVRHPTKVSAIYCDTPVCDFKSWPAGKGDGIGSDSTWKQCLDIYGYSEEQALAFQGNPINHAKTIAAAGIPILHVVSENDRVVPPHENTYVLKERLQSEGGDLELIRVPAGTAKSNGHHFTHPAPERVVAFIATHGSVTTAKPDGDASGIRFGDQDWPWWRGPKRNGIASSDSMPPTIWSDTQNIVWERKIPGRSHGSVTVLGDRLFLQVADEKEQTQSVICLDRKSGDVRWMREVHRGGFAKKINTKASHASSTIATDGRLLFANFVNQGAVQTTALDLEGNQIWQKKINDYVVHQGYGSSPAIYKSLVIISADTKAKGAVVGLNRTNGEEIWRINRPKKPNYSSPIILNVAGRDQLIMTGCNLVLGSDPLTGKPFWEVPGATTECVTSTVTNGQLIYTSGGYPDNHVAAVKADGSGEAVWKNGTRVYVPSMLLKDGFLYAVADAGFAVCWDAATGEEQWKGRLGGTFSASPVMVGDLIYATNESGETLIFKADPESYARVGKNKLGDNVIATPTICGGRIYMRIARRVGDNREESIVCIGDKLSSPE
jgi:outer membrane protein assembly factor BamB